MLENNVYCSTALLLYLLTIKDLYVLDPRSSNETLEIQASKSGNLKKKDRSVGGHHHTHCDILDHDTDSFLC